MIAWLKENPLYAVAAVILLVMSSVALKSCYDNSVIEKNEVKIERKIQKTKEKADSKADDRRIEDALNVQKDEEEKLDAIHNEIDSDVPASTRSLNCIRLRNAGQVSSAAYARYCSSD